jgi:hypothetical protein
MGLDIYFFAREKNSTQTERTEVGYFRKVNALVGWIESHVGSVENCEELLIQRTHLEILHDDLERLTSQNCTEVFPTCEGFFFGSQDYGDWYWKDVDEVKTWCSRILESFDFERRTLVFWAWW